MCSPGGPRSLVQGVVCWQPGSEHCSNQPYGGHFGLFDVPPVGWETRMDRLFNLAVYSGVRSVPWSAAQLILRRIMCEVDPASWTELG